MLYGGLLGYNIVSAGIFDSPVLFICLFQHHFYFPAYLLGGFTFGDLLGRPWSRVSSLIPPTTCLSVLSRIGFRIPLLVEIHRMELTHALARSATVFFFLIQEKVPTSMHSVRLEPTKLIFIGTRTTSKATGGAGCGRCFYPVFTLPQTPVRAIMIATGYIVCCTAVISTYNKVYQGV